MCMGGGGGDNFLNRLRSDSFSLRLKRIYIFRGKWGEKEREGERERERERKSERERERER